MKQARTNKERLADILEAIAAIERHPVASRKAFDDDELIRFFLLKHVEIIGEAVFKISGDLKEAHPEVPWRKVETARHILVHDYWRVDWEILWQIVTKHLGPLRGQVEEILKSLGGH